MTLRQEKITSHLKNTVSQYLKGIDFESRIVSITRLEISRDLKSAKIFVSSFPVGGEEKVLEILNKEKGEIKKYLSRKTKMKFLPELQFLEDKGEKNRQRIEELLNT